MTVIAALGTIAPLGWVTTPVIEPVFDWAKAPVASTKSRDREIKVLLIWVVEDFIQTSACLSLIFSVAGSEISRRDNAIPECMKPMYAGSQPLLSQASKHHQFLGN